MTSLEEQTKQSCNALEESKKTPVIQKPSGSHTSYALIRNLMKRLNTALSKRLREGRPSKYCRFCRAELLSISKELSEKKKKSTAIRQRITKKPNLRRTRTKPNSSDGIKETDSG